MMKRFYPSVTTTTKALYGGISILLIASGIISFIQSAPLSVSILLVISGLLPAALLIIPYKTRYTLAEDHLLCEWIFGKKKIPYRAIQEVKSYHLSLRSIRRFGVSFVGGRYSSKDAGKFFAMFGGDRNGLMIVSTSEEVYGGKIYLTPQDEENFIKELKTRTNAAFSLNSTAK